MPITEIPFQKETLVFIYKYMYVKMYNYKNVYLRVVYMYNYICVFMYVFIHCTILRFSIYMFVYVRNHICLSLYYFVHHWLY